MYFESEGSLNELATALENDPRFQAYVSQWNNNQAAPSQPQQQQGAWFSSPTGENGEQQVQFIPMPKLAAGPGYGGAFPDEATVKNALARPVPDNLPYHLQLQMMQARQPVLKDTVYQSPTTGSFARRTDIDRNATLSNIMKAEQGVNAYMTKAEDAALKRQKAMLDLETARLQKERLQQQLSSAGRAPAGYRYTAEGNMEPIPGGPADAKARAKSELQAAGATDVDLAIGILRDAYDRLDKGGGITNTEKGTIDNVIASVGASAPGQIVGKALGTQNQSARNDIAMTRPALLAALMKATGMSAKQMDSNAELKLWMTTATDPTLDVQANRRALENIEKKYIRRSDVEPQAAATQRPSGQSVPPSTPQTGQVVNGYKFLGGNPADQSRWMKVQ